MLCLLLQAVACAPSHTVVNFDFAWRFTADSFEPRFAQCVPADARLRTLIVEDT